MTDHCTHWTAYPYMMYVGMMHALMASTQEDRMSDGGKGEGTRGRDRDRESVSVSQDYFIENNPMFPCWYSHTNTPTAFSPLIEYLDKGDKSFHSELASGKSGPERECVQGSTALDRRK